MNNDFVVKLRWLGDHASFDPHMYHVAANHIEDLNFQIKVIQGAAAHALKSYKEHLAVYRQKLEEKPPIWHDDIQSLQERDAIMTDRIEKLEAALRLIAEAVGDPSAYWIARKALEGKDGVD